MAIGSGRVILNQQSSSVSNGWLTAKMWAYFLMQSDQLFHSNVNPDIEQMGLPEYVIFTLNFPQSEYHKLWGVFNGTFETQKQHPLSKGKSQRTGSLSNDTQTGLQGLPGRVFQVT